MLMSVRWPAYVLQGTFRHALMIRPASLAADPGLVWQPGMRFLLQQGTGSCI